MQDLEEIRNAETCKDHHHMQIIIKGKRTKRQRLPSPLRLTMSTTTCSSLGGRSSTDNSIGFDVPTTSNDQELRNGTEEEEQDMANCLILLAQGHNNTPKPSHMSPHVAARDYSNKGGGLYLYECKTCNRCFPSFQALGGHRASHKKFKTSNEEKQGVTSFVNEADNHNNDDHGHEPTSTNLTLQLSATLYNSSNTTRTINVKSKVHECSICGAEFTSGQALGGHMRRHRSILSGAIANGGDGSPEIQETKKHNKDVLNLDLNLPAPEDDHRESKLFPFESKDKVIALTTSLVDCHY